MIATILRVSVQWDNLMIDNPNDSVHGIMSISGVNDLFQNIKETATSEF